MKKQKFQPNFVINESGKPIAVQLDIKEYKALLEEVEDRIDVKREEKILAKKCKSLSLAEKDSYEHY